MRSELYRCPGFAARVRDRNGAAQSHEGSRRYCSEGRRSNLFRAKSLATLSSGRWQAQRLVPENEWATRTERLALAGESGLMRASFSVRERLGCMPTGLPGRGMNSCQIHL